MKPVVKASDVERFNSWLDRAVTKFTKSYEAKIRDVFGDSTYQIMPKPNIRDLSDKIFYHSRIFHGQVIKR